jgi:sigma-B regulation protein RsbU (phosphoserine phosphatase)
VKEQHPMRILSAWNNPAEAELLTLYLDLEGNQLAVATDATECLALARSQDWDAVLLSLSFPDVDGAYQIFEQLRGILPGCPIVGACFPQEVFQLARFMTNGLKAYILRDDVGDFLFLVNVTLQNAIAGILAERSQKLAEKLREEIDSVRKLQETFIPINLEAPCGYSVAARYEPSQIQVMGGAPVVLAGGDYYDVFKINDTTMVVLVGDASGHGMKACMSIMIMHTLVRMIRSTVYCDTAAFVREINKHLCSQSVVQQEGGFITLLYGVLNSDTHEFQWTSAGHPMPMLHDLTNGTIGEMGDIEMSGLPLGVYDDADYETCSMIIPPNSKLILLTDGIIEAFPAARTDGHCEFGLNGVVSTLKAVAERDPAETLQALFDASNAFTEGSGRHDDTSVVVLSRK